MWIQKEEVMAQNVSWSGQRDLIDAVVAERDSALAAYRAKPILVREHLNQEESFRTGGYARRQLMELVQNAADAVHRGGRPGRIELRIVGDTLYCANEGESITRSGVQALANAFVSDKRGDEIGRFGLGFKSVLSVTKHVQLLSRSVSFEFGGPASGSVADGATRVPTMRLPRPISAADVFSEDRIAAEMSEWATTIVRLPGLLDRDRLVEQLEHFSTEFLLFTPSVSSLRLTLDDEQDVTHTAERHHDGTVTLVNAAGRANRWLVSIEDHAPSAKAIKEVGDFIARESVRLTLAIRMDGRARTGRFWAYFPLQDETSASGIFNAPWRVNDDRTSLIDGEFNDELLRVFTRMFIDALAFIPRSDDPARLLDYLPSRARELMSAADERLTQWIPELALRRALIPDLNGQLRKPEELRYPSDSIDLTAEQMRWWQKAELLVGDDDDVPNASCYTTPERRAKLRRMLEASDPQHTRELGPRQWLDLVASEGYSEALVEAVKLLVSINDKQLRNHAAGARIIPLTDGTLAPASDTKRVFLGPADIEAPEVRFISEEFVALPGMEAALAELGFRRLDERLRLQVLLSTITLESSPASWEQLWNSVDDVSWQDARDLFERHVSNGHDIAVRCRDGLWRDAKTVVLPQGTLSPASDAMSLDTGFHGTDQRLLAPTGLICGIDLSWHDPADTVMEVYQTSVVDAERSKLRAMGAPQATSSMSFREHHGPGPLGLLQLLAADGDVLGQLAWSQLLTNADAPRTWTLAVRNGPVLTVEAPHLWAVNRFGLVQTTKGPRPPALSLDPELRRFSAYLPVATQEQSRRLHLVSDLESIPVPVWEEFLSDDQPLALPVNPIDLSALVVAAIRKVPHPPDVVPAISGATRALISTSELLVAIDATEVDQIKVYGDRAYLLVPDALAARSLADALGARLAAESITTAAVIEGAQERRLATDRYPGLRKLKGDPLRGVAIVLCEMLATDTVMAEGVRRTAKAALRDEETLFVQYPTDDAGIVHALSREWALGLTPPDVQRVLDRSKELRTQETMDLCRSEPDPVRKLLLLASAAQLQKRLPEGLIDAVEQLGASTDDASVSELFLRVHRSAALETLKAVLQSNGFPAPDRWAGSTDALEFVRDLGFDNRYAGEPSLSLEKSFKIIGKPDLNPLHDYQEELAGQIRDVIRGGQVPARKALMFLPTGAGKTRVTVEAVVRSILDHEIDGPILWIAQSEELCEQAVQTWSQVWRLMADTRSMSIGRLWGGNQVPHADTDVQVVVASDAKLNLVRHDIAYGWLSAAAVVIIDEAHRAAIAQTYTSIMRWLGVDGRSHDRPLLGLTATPFRSNEENSDSLAARFDRNRLVAPSLGDEPYEPLQQMGVLARIRHEQIDGVRQMDLSRSELETLEAPSFRRISQVTMTRIAEDSDRTLGIVRHIESNPQAWPALVFTPNVLSAQVLAALLLSRGIEAAAISGETRTQERRRVLKAFASGDVQVITNCDVLTQGFDAPGVKSLYLARPTLSPNAYIQMVGRGLRGPLNGGKAECLIVDVVDTFSNFDEKLAFTQFDSVWKNNRLEDLA
jgi:superfamily II DNA or RNA helicase